MQERRSDLPAMALASCSVLFYSIAVTRLLSVVLWYHFAFLSISLAMLGIGAAGAWRALWQAGERSLERAWLAAAIAIPASVLVILHVSWLPAIVLALLAPMLALGVALSTLLARATPQRIGVLYAADLLGSTLGAALVLPVLRWVATPLALVCLGILPLLALAVQSGWRRPAWLAGCACIAGLAAWGSPLEVQRSKLYAEQGATAPMFERWTESARITVFDRPIFSPEPDVPWGWGYGDNFEPRPWQERWIDQDGSAGTPVERLPGDPRELEHLFFDVTSAGYSILRPEHVCVIGAGGGRDIVTALAAGARQVDAVELNRGIFELMTGPLAEFSGSIYRRPGVRAVVSEGRSFLTQTEQRYDLLQISLVDSWAATAAGAFALSENYLYTVEAMQLYLSRLRPGGVVSISRWTDRVQPFEATRLILLAEEALRRNGASAPRDHLLLLRGSAIGTLLVGERPFDDALRERAEAVAAQYGFTRLWPPRAGPPTIVAVAMSDGGETFTRAGLDLTPPVDDRPFFFQAQRIAQLGLDVEKAAPSDVNLQGVTLLRQLVIGLTALAIAVFLAPLVLFERSARGAELWRGSVYFACIGAGFMTLELPWIQASVLFLGQPSAAAAVVLASLLLGAGLGSALSGRLSLRWFWLVPLVAASVSLAIGPLFRAGLALPLPLRTAQAALLFACAGLCLGLPLPFGFRSFAAVSRPWLWAINGCASVLASALSIALAMALGFRATAAIGVACYVIAGVTLAGFHRKAGRREAGI